MAADDVREIEHGEHSRPRQDRLIRLIDEIQRIAIPVVKPGRLGLVRGDRGNPPVIHKGFVGLDESVALSARATGFRAHPDALETGGVAGNRIAILVKQVVPLREFHDHRDVRVRLRCRSNEDVAGHRGHQLAAVLAPGPIASRLHGFLAHVSRAEKIVDDKHVEQGRNGTHHRFEILPGFRVLPVVPIQRPLLADARLSAGGGGDTAHHLEPVVAEMVPHPGKVPGRNDLTTAVDLDRDACKPILAKQRHGILLQLKKAFDRPGRQVRPQNQVVPAGLCPLVHGFGSRARANGT